MQHPSASKKHVASCTMGVERLVHVTFSWPLRTFLILVYWHASDTYILTLSRELTKPIGTSCPLND